MTGTIAAVRAQLSKGCVVRRCQKNGCAVSLAEMPQPRLVVDLDKPGSPLGPAQTRCDYLFLAESSCSELWLAPIELKKGTVDAGKAIEQLQAGAQAAEGIIPPLGAGIDVRFRPVLASGGGMHKAERDKLKTEANRVTFRGYSEAIRRIRCDAPLIDSFNCRRTRRRGAGLRFVSGYDDTASGHG